MPELTFPFVAVAERSVCLGESRRGNGEEEEKKERRERTREEREEGGGGERGQLEGSRAGVPQRSLWVLLGFIVHGKA